MASAPPSMASDVFVMASLPDCRMRAGSASSPAKRAFGAERLLDAQRLVPLGHALGARERADLELPGRTSRSARWTIATSSVSPERAETMVPKPARRAASQAALAALTVPAWLTLTSTAFDRAARAAAARTLSRVGHEQVVADDLDAVADRRHEALEADGVVLARTGPRSRGSDSARTSRAASRRRPSRSRSRFSRPSR